MAGVHAALLGSTSKADIAVVISADQGDVNLRNLLLAAGWNGQQVLDATVTINPGVVVSASSTSVYALDTGTTQFPFGSRVRINNQGYIIGRGGNANSGAGGPALRVVGGINLACTVDNTGTIGGGGGGGGVGQSVSGYVTVNVGDSSVDESFSVTGGSGGGGRTGRWNSSPNGTFASAGAGTAGSSAAAGAGTQRGGTGGSGGNWGESGSSGALYTYTLKNPVILSSSGPGSGGPAGAAISGAANITWINTGTRLGAIT